MVPWHVIIQICCLGFQKKKSISCLWSKGEILARFKAVLRAVFCNHKTKKNENHAKKPLTHWLGTYQGAFEKLGEYIREKFTGGFFRGHLTRGEFALGRCSWHHFLIPFSKFFLILMTLFNVLCYIIN